MVAGRGADRPADQIDPALGQARHPALRPKRSAPILGLDLRSDLPVGGQGGRHRHAGLQQRGDDDAPREIAFNVAPGAHAVVILDQAGWHGSAELVIPPNITLMLLPPRCPELNPVENIWQFMRDNWLSNRIFKS